MKKKIQNKLKKNVALNVIKYIKKNMFLGIGTGSTINFLINEVNSYKNLVKGIVSSSKMTTNLLKRNNVNNIYKINKIDRINLYIDSADEVNFNFDMIKGGGGALTREKIVSHYSDYFICIVDSTKIVKKFNKFPLPIEILPFALNYIKKELIKINKNILFSVRKNFITDNGNLILDVKNLDLSNPKYIEKKLNNLPGIVSSGIFSIRKPDLLLISTFDGIKKIKIKNKNTLKSLKL
ncbi:ribose-5-phosphate isomerase RpiA [Buchnera aphidicola]|uniref:ribose-5-phosphate isomerase RpiA n=1 Tax=Buchnera aphidicola TaxID=9 RepID=UPI0030ECBD14